MQQPLHCLLFLLITLIHSNLLSNAAQPFIISGTQPVTISGAQPITISGAQHFDFLSANISTKWVNNPSNHYISSIKSILVRETSGPAFYCGFISPIKYGRTNFLFSIFISPYAIDNITFPTDPQIVWSANRERLVGENATLEFSKRGDLILRDFDGTQVWSTNTSGKSVVRMYLNEVGSLVLSDNKNNTVWSSIDFPTDCLVLGQTLRQGQRLTANVSVTDSSQGQVYLSIVRGGFQAFVGSNPPQLYYDTIDNLSLVKHTLSGTNILPSEQKKPTYVSFNNGSLDVFTGSSLPYGSLPLQLANSVQYMRLDYGGHLRIYEWKSTAGWVLLGDVLFLDDDCIYPTVCGEYGICSNGQCTCPSSVNDNLNYFRPVDQRNPHAGCMPSTAISCKSNKKHEFMLLQNVSYFNYIDYEAAYMKNTNAEACKQACLVNCPCKAALFQYGQNASSGNCFLPSELYSLTYNNLFNMEHNLSYNSSAFIKVQSFPTTNSVLGTNSSSFSKSKKVSTGVTVGASVGSLLAFFLVVVCIIALIWRRNRYREVEDDDEFNMLPGLPTRFTFEDLRVATKDFLLKLGEGGFGSVFEGTLIDDTKIAVKRLDSVGQGKKEFLAEVETIGSIHHIHLVKLIGFCAEKSYRLLIYEYMPNGSLDKWIFYKDHHNIVLDWQTRRKIIIGIARGLAYLHVDCRQKIVHLDIKPQNILLNENFDAKVSDFGLAKLIDRDQIEVRTRMRGTPGYLAPEWLTSVITEKVDVFSFGVVVLEIVCGRRNLDYSKDDESLHLIGMLQQKVEENKLVDIIDCRSTDMQLHIEDVTMVMHLAMWCLQSDSNKRPCMSKVLKVLEGSMNVEANLDYNFTNLAPYVSRNVNTVESVLPIASILSGPR